VLGLLVAGLGIGLGTRAMAFFLAQGAVAFLLLELINYVEHYGLQRRMLGSGRYERVGSAHSWNASNRLTNWYLFNLQRHADHHIAASRPYWFLRHSPDSPQLPAGYATMCLVALLPPLWRRIMDPRVAALAAAHACTEEDQQT
jgi:alkane 1-monooxygenase